MVDDKADDEISEQDVKNILKEINETEAPVKEVNSKAALLAKIKANAAEGEKE
jgi:adenylate kinase family enzyme